MRPVLDVCDRERIPAHLEASTDRNRMLYERNGFALTEVFDMPGRGGPPIREMWRGDRRALMLREGSGEPLVLFHGILCSERVWRNVVPLLARGLRRDRARPPSATGAAAAGRAARRRSTT